MTAEPFDVAPIAARLLQEVPALRQVGLAADYAAITSLQDFPAPCAYVVLGREKGTQNAPGHAPAGQIANVRQPTSVTFGVVVAVRNYREQRGEQMSDDLRAILGQTREALIGFVPPVAGGRACQFVQGDVQDYDASTMLWVDVFQTQHFIGSKRQ